MKTRFDKWLPLPAALLALTFTLPASAEDSASADGELRIARELRDQMRQLEQGDSADGTEDKPSGNLNPLNTNAMGEDRMNIKNTNARPRTRPEQLREKEGQKSKYWLIETYEQVSGKKLITGSKKRVEKDEEFRSDALSAEKTIARSLLPDKHGKREDTQKTSSQEAASLFGDEQGALKSENPLDPSVILGERKADGSVKRSDAINSLEDLERMFAIQAEEQEQPAEDLPEGAEGLQANPYLAALSADLGIDLTGAGSSGPSLQDQLLADSLPQGGVNSNDPRFDENQVFNPNLGDGLRDMLPKDMTSLLDGDGLGDVSGLDSGKGPLNLPNFMNPGAEGFGLPRPQESSTNPFANPAPDLPGSTVRSRERDQRMEQFIPQMDRF